MPTELEDLVEFLHHGNTQIRQVAIENLVGYSIAQPSIFKIRNAEPVKDLKVLVRDYPPIAKNVLTILVNLSHDREILENLATDDAFLESLLNRITNPKEPTANLISMLLSNLVKHDSLKRAITLKRDVPKELTTSKQALDQLMDCFVRGAEGRWNKEADFDYLAYFFADIAKYPEGRKYFVTKQEYDEVVPISKLAVFTEHNSDIRRRGVASTIKNAAFEISAHPLLLSSAEVDLLPYILLPLMGPDDYPETESDLFPPALQLLPSNKAREFDHTILLAHLETLLLLTTTRPGRQQMRACGVYPLIREAHLHVENEEVREACERLVHMLMADDPEGEGDDYVKGKEDGGFVQVAEESDDDDKVMDIF